MRFYKCIVTYVSIAAILFLISGCGKGSGPKLFHVSGTVTVKGSPLPNVKVQLFPVEGKNKAGLIASGVTDSQGKFSVASPGNRSGAAAGSYRVALSPVSVAVTEDQAAKMAAAQLEYSKKLQEASKKVAANANKGPSQEALKKAMGNPEGMKELNREMAERSKGRVVEMDKIKMIDGSADLFPQEYSSAATSPKEVEVKDTAVVIELAL